MVVNSDDVAEELVKKLRAAGFDINPEIVTCADLITLLGACQIHSPRRFRAKVPEPHIVAGKKGFKTIIETPDPLVYIMAGSDTEAKLTRMVDFMVDACNRYLP